MKVEQKRLINENNWEYSAKNESFNKADLVFVFGSTNNLKNEDYIKQILDFYPSAVLIGCSTAGEISDVNVYDNSIVVTAVDFDYTTVKKISADVNDFENDFEAGKFLANSFEKEKLTHVFILSDGLNVNGTDLVQGLISNLPENISVSGGLSGDGDRFQETLVLLDNSSSSNKIIAVGLYSDRLKIGCGSLGGWDPFGPERLITNSKGNILYELDGKSALTLYKSYLGEHAQGLPATGLLFPLSLRSEGKAKAVVRTILSVNEEDQSMTFAGDIPTGSYARLMKANVDRLIDGAYGAAMKSSESLNHQDPDLVILISCVGRKMVLKQRTEEEIEAVRDVVGKNAVITGFYSYGEISPFGPESKCELHNQTMTITSFVEI